MKKARKPISLLLALVMALSLAATLAWAAGAPVDFTGKVGTTFKDVLGASTFKPSEPWLYNIDTAPSKLESDSTELKAVVSENGAPNAVYWLKAGITYTLTYDTAATVKISKAGSMGIGTYVTVPDTSSTSVSNVYVFKSGSAGLYQVEGTYEDSSSATVKYYGSDEVKIYLAESTTETNTALTASTDTTNEPNCYKLEANTYYAVHATKAGRVRLNFGINAPQRGNANGATYSYKNTNVPAGNTWNLNPTTSGMYTLTVTSTSKTGNVTSPNNNALSITIKDSNGTGLGSIESTPVSTGAMGQTVVTYYLEGGKNYTVTAKPTTSSGSDATTTYTDVFSLVSNGNLIATGNKTLNTKAYVKFNASSSLSEAYEPVYFAFRPDASGWYRVKANVQGANSTDKGLQLLTATNETAAVIDSIKPVYTLTGDADTNKEKTAAVATNANTTNEYAFGLGMSGYFDNEHTYLFKYVPLMTEGETGKGSNTAKPKSVSITIAKDSTDSTQVLKGGSVTCTGMKRGGTSIVKFTPNPGGELTLRFTPAKQGNYNGAIGTVTVYDEEGWEVSGLTSEEGNLTTSGNSAYGGTVKATFKANHDYYIAISNTDYDNWAPSCVVSVEQKDAVKVSPANATNVQVVLSDGTKSRELTLADGSCDLTGLTDGQTYTVSASAPGYFDSQQTFKAGSAGNVTLQLVAKPSLAPANGNSTFSEGKVSFTEPSGAKLTVDVTCKDIMADTDGQYWVGISIPHVDGAKVYFDYGTYNYGNGNLVPKDVANKGNAVYTVGNAGGKDSIYINAFSGASGDPQSAYIRVLYADGSAAIYQLNMSKANVTRDLSADDKSDVYSAVADATATESKVTGLGEGNDLGTAIAQSVTVGKGVPSPLATRTNQLAKDKVNLANKAWSAIQKYLPNKNDNASTSNITGHDFDIFDVIYKDTTRNYYDQLGNITTAGKEKVKKDLTAVLVFPVLKVSIPRNPVYAKSGDTNWASFTVDVNAYARTLVTKNDKTVHEGIYKDITSAVTQLKAPTGTAVKAKADLKKADGSYNTINAIQVGIDEKIAVNDPIQLTLNYGGKFDPKNSVYILHTHDAKTYQYEVTSGKGLDTSKKTITFVSAHGLSEFTFSVESKNQAAYIERSINGETCKIWYDSLANAIADAHHSEIITVWTSVPEATNVVATNRNGASSLTFATANGAKVQSKTFTINGTAVSMYEDKTGGVWNGKAQGTDPTANDRVVLKQTTGATAKVTSSTLNPDEGETVQISVTAQSGYVNNGLSVVAASGSNPAVTTVSTSGSTTVYSFKMPAAKVTVTPVVTKISNDTVTIKNANTNAGAVAVSSERPAVGSTVTVTTTPKTGYKLASITAYNTTTAKAVSLTGAGSGTYTFKMQSGGVTVTTTWATTNTVSIVDNGYGEVTASDVNAKPGTAVALSAMPDSGFMLTSIQVRGEGDTPVTTFRSGSLYYFTMPASGGVTVTPAWRLSSAPAPYTDAIAEWAKNYVEYAYRNNLMTGTTATTFGGSSTVTRGEIWTILARYDGFYPKSNANPWYNEARVWAMNKSNAGGGYVSDGTNGGGYVTREQLATMLWRYAGSPVSNQSLAAFPDANKIHSEWSGFEPAMRWAVEKGILSGKPAAKGKTLYLDPTGNATRNEVAKMIAQFVLST